MGARPAHRATPGLGPAGPRTAGEQPDAVEVTLYHDVFCSWCYVADQRLDRLRDEYGPALRWSLKGYPLRPDDQLPDRKQRQLLARHFRRVAREKEGRGVKPDLWTGEDPPASSMPPLIALEAALLQGRLPQRELLRAMRRAAFLDGINVARRDVLVELAGQAGLDLPRFLQRLDDPRTEGLVSLGCEEAEGIGIKGVPAVVIGGEWLMQGAREIGEYRQVIDKYLTERAEGGRLRVLH